MKVHTYQIVPRPKPMIDIDISQVHHIRRHPYLLDYYQLVLNDSTQHVINEATKEDIEREIKQCRR